MREPTDNATEARLIQKVQEARTLLELQGVAHATAVTKGWHDGADPERDFQKWIALAHSELSEALDAHRKGRGLAAIGEELADVVIRVMDTAEAMGIDLEGAVRQKMWFNAMRSQRHGGLPY